MLMVFDVKYKENKKNIVKHYCYNKAIGKNDNEKSISDFCCKIIKNDLPKDTIADVNWRYSDSKEIIKNFKDFKFIEPSIDTEEFDKASSGNHHGPTRYRSAKKDYSRYEY